MTSVFSLLSIICSVQYQEVKLISELNHFFNFDYNLFLLDSSVNLNHFINSKRQEYTATPHTVIVFHQSPKQNITELDTLTEVTSKNTFMIAVLESSTLDANFNFLNRLKEIQRLQINMKIGFFFRFDSLEDLRKLFQWCKEHLIVNVFAATYSYPTDEDLTLNAERLLNVFTFDTFGTFDVINVTDSETYAAYFPSLNSNFRQHELLLGKPYQYSTDEEVWSTVFRMMNATSMIDDNNYTTHYELSENGIDIVPMWFVLTKVAHLKMYPLMMLPQVIIVPQALPYSDFSNYLQAMTSNSFFGYSFIAISVVVLFLTIFRYIKEKKNLFFHSVVDIGNLLLNDNSYIKYHLLSRAEVFLILPLTFVGFVIVNGILSNLQSYLTRPQIQPQIKTIEEIYSSTLAIATTHEIWKEDLTEALNSRSKHEQWKNKIVILEENLFFERLYVYNTATSYYLNTIDADMMLSFQKLLDIRGYYDPNIQITVFPLSYLVNEKFLYFERLNDIINRIRSAGLFEHWIRRMSEEKGRIVLQEYLHRLNDSQGVGETFEFPIFVVYGWIASTIVLIVEIIWTNITAFRSIIRGKIEQFFLGSFHYGL